MITEDYTRKLTRMRISEKERKQRIFNDKQRLIGVSSAKFLFHVITDHTHSINLNIHNMS